MIPKYRKQFNEEFSQETVSYTHLDVYKRQVLEFRILRGIFYHTFMRLSLIHI